MEFSSFLDQHYQSKLANNHDAVKNVDILKASEVLFEILNQFQP